MSEGKGTPMLTQPYESQKTTCGGQSFYHVGPRDQTQGGGLGIQDTYPLRHLISPKVTFYVEPKRH